jgi:hypothetical protein
MPLPPPPSVGVEDDACYTNADSSPAMLAHTICQALNARTLFDQPLLASRAGGKGSDDDGSTSGSGQSWIARRIGMVLPSPSKCRHNSNKGGGQVKAEAMKRAIATAMRVASNNNGDGNGGKSDGDSDEGVGQATTREMAAVMTVAGDNEGNGNGDERATKRVRVLKQERIFYSNSRFEVGN